MNENTILQNLLQSIKSAKASLEAVEKWTEALRDGSDISLISGEQNISITQETEDEEDGNVVEGVFDGKNMIALDGTQFPVPANYASKSKLVEGDSLKLTIKLNGAFLFKQINLIPRKTLIGKLVLEGSQYKVLTQDKSFSILYASVTFYKGKVGDDVSIVVPLEGDSSWAAVESIIPAKLNIQA